MGDELSDALGSTAKALENVTDIFHKLAGPVAEEIGLAWAANVYEYRVRNLVSILKRTGAMLRNAKISPEMIPPRFSVAALSAASLEDDPGLQELWAGLLANAASPATSQTILPSFIEVLKQLTPFEAQVLNRLFDAVTTRRIQSRPNERVIPIEPHFGVHGVALGEQSTLAMTSLGSEDPNEWWKFEQGYDFQLLITDLSRLGLIESHDPGLTINRNARRIDDAFKTGKRMYYFTAFAYAFVRACRCPESAAEMSQG
ncbi:MAG: Abi-alpha family protein [Terriglobales bacterium]|jgi:hypothetical protein